MRFLRRMRPVLLGCGLVLSTGNGLLFGDEPIAPANEFSTISDQSGNSMHELSDPIIPAGATESALDAHDQVETLVEGTSDRAALKAAKSRLPLARMSAANRQRAEAVVKNLSMFRAMPTIRMPVDHNVYRFFIDHPDVAVSTWRALEVSKCQLWQTGPDSYETEVGDGSVGAIDVLFRGPNDHVVIGEGRFKSPMLVKPIEAVGVMHLHTQFITKPDGQTETICHANLFVAFPSQAVETAAKVVSPLTNMVIDRNFQEVGVYAHVMTMAMRNQPGWVENLAGQLGGILERNRVEFMEVTAKAFVANRKWELSHGGQGIQQADGQLVIPAGR